MATKSDVRIRTKTISNKKRGSKDAPNGIWNTYQNKKKRLNTATRAQLCGNIGNLDFVTHSHLLLKKRMIGMLFARRKK